MSMTEKLALRWPITTQDERVIDSVEFKPITYQVHNQIIAQAKDDERLLSGLLVKASCGLEEADIRKLKQPDWNAIRLRIVDLVTKDSAFFLKKQGITQSTDNIVLLNPILSDIGESIKTLTLQIPTVETTDLMQKQPTAEEQTLFINMACTGLSKTEMNRLSVPDWIYLQKQLNHFLNEPADSFPLGM